MSVTGGATQVSVASLQQLRGALQFILDEVNAQLSGQLPEGKAPVEINSDLAVQAGCTVDFNVAADLNTALNLMGGSVQDQLLWLSQKLTAMIGEISASIGSLASTETLNASQVAALIGQLENTIGVPAKQADPLADQPKQFHVEALLTGQAEN